MPNKTNLPVDDRPSGELFEAPKIESNSPKWSEVLRRHAAYYYKLWFKGEVKEEDEPQLRAAVQRHRGGEFDFRRPKDKGSEGQQGGGETKG